MVSSFKLTIINLLILYCNYSTVFCFNDDSIGEDLQVDLEKIVDIRQKFLKAGSLNPEIFRALRQWDVSQAQEVSLKSDFANMNQCDSDLAYIVKDLISPSPGGDRMWALQVVDSFGKPPAGFLKGGISWPGNFDECLQVSAPSRNARTIRFHYAWLAITLQADTSASQPITVNIGGCFPSSCSGDSLLQLYNSTTQLLDFIFFWKKVSPKMPKLGVKFVEDEFPLSPASVACICICSLFAFLVLAGTVVDIVKRWKDKRIPPNLPKSDDVDDDPICSDIGSSNSDQIDGSDTTQLVVIAECKRKSIARDFLLCFSAISNTESILNTKSSEGQLDCIHGIRFLSMSWVILGHTYFFGLGLYGNILDIFEKIDTWPIQVILQGTYSVDTFFLLSGCLLTYHFLRNKEKFVGWKNWVMFYVHRYVRLTPVYAMVMFIFATWFGNLGNGPFWTYNQLEGTCSKSWWWHLLYINNFLDAMKMCVGWAWYLANDMQFYVISPLFLFAFKRNRTAGLLVVLVLLVASWTAAGVISRVYHVDVIFSNINGVNETQLAEQQGDMFDKMYTKPYTRIGPYLIGVLVGCLLDMANDRKRFLHKVKLTR